MSFLLEHDALNGKEGSAFMTINGRNIEMFGMKKFQSDAEFQDEAGSEKDNGSIPDRLHDDLLRDTSFPAAFAGVYQNRTSALFYTADYK